MNHWEKKIANRKETVNHLEMNYLQRKGFSNWMAYLSCSFGSMVPGYPDGSAHFLEHRLFDFNGVDGTELFSKLGADVNAFTARRIMGFYFSTLNHPYESIQLLTNLALETREFSTKAIENEKKIIENEINMVEDDPFGKGYQQLLEQMYWDHPVRLKIAGTKESIHKINKKILTTIHRNYFNPMTCKMIISGTDSPDQFFTRVSKILDFSQWNPPNPLEQTLFLDEPLAVKTPFFEFNRPVSKDLVFIGFKTTKKKFNLTDSLVGEFLSHIIFGSISSFTDQLYSMNYIDDSFYFSYDWDIDYGYLMLAGYTSDTNQLRKLMEKEIKKRLVKGVSQEEFDIIQHYFLGSTYIMIDKPGELMMHLTNLSWTQNQKWEDYLQAVKNLSVDLINREIKHFIDLDYSAVTVIHPL